jgi:hypothetical protein
MRGWLSGAVAAARVAADRAELWLPGALPPFAAAGWLVLLLTVAPLPDASGAAGLGLRLMASGWFPWNVVVLLVAVASGLATLLLVVAFGEVALLMGLSDPAGAEPLPTVPRAMGVLAVAGLPVLVTAAGLAWLAAPAVIDVVTLPDPFTPAPIRVAAATWPLLVALAAVIVAAQAFGAAALRSQRGGRGGQGRLRASGRRVVRLLPQAAVTMAAFVLGQLATAVVLALLWRPLDTRLETGGLAQPTTVILLVGFVWIWLVLVILAGVVQAWTSAWWSAALDAGSATETMEGDR